jgi:hypothetical protein
VWISRRGRALRRPWVAVYPRSAQGQPLRNPPVLQAKLDIHASEKSEMTLKQQTSEQPQVARGYAKRSDSGSAVNDNLGLNGDHPDGQQHTAALP